MYLGFILALKDSKIRAFREVGNTVQVEGILVLYRYSRKYIGGN